MPRITIQRLGTAGVRPWLAGASALALGLAGLSLAACNRNAAAAPAPLAALPPVTGPAQTLATAPAVDDLAQAPPPPVARLADPDEGYAFADRAYAMSAAFADSPPDYDIDDGGVTPWVWVSDDGSECIAEAVPGGERYYYYDPGSDEPFFVSDPSGGYGFENGTLVVVYGRDGHERRDFGGDADETAGRFLVDARTVRQAANQQPHRPIVAANWEARRSVIQSQQAVWAGDVNADPSWRAYHDQNQAAEAAHWAGETGRRDAWAARQDNRFGQTDRAQHELAAAQTAFDNPPTASGQRPPLPGQSGQPFQPPAHAYASAGQTGDAKGAAGVSTSGPTPTGPVANGSGRPPEHGSQAAGAWQGHGDGAQSAAGTPQRTATFNPTPATHTAPSTGGGSPRFAEMRGATHNPAVAAGHTPAPSTSANGGAHVLARQSGPTFTATRTPSGPPPQQHVFQSAPQHTATNPPAQHVVTKTPPHPASGQKTPPPTAASTTRDDKHG